MLRKFFTYFLITNFLAISLFGEDTVVEPQTASTKSLQSPAPNKSNPGQNPFNPSDQGYNRYTDGGVLQTHLSGQIIKRLGEPGYYFSKYLNYRKQITKPVCYTSEQINKAAIVISLAGEVTLHAFDYFETKKLKKKYESELEEINKYRAELSTEKKSILEFDSKSPEAQIGSLKYLRSSAEVELKRAEMNRKFVYTVLGLQITSQIVAALEAAAETGSGGSLMAKNEFCYAKKQQEQAAQEAKTAQLLKKEIENKPKTALTDYAKDVSEQTPWYVMPFKWLAGGLGFIEDSSIFQKYKSYKGGVSKEQRIREGNTGGAQEEIMANKENGGGLAKEMNIATGFIEMHESAAYAESMLVDVVMDVVKKLGNKNSKRTLQEEIDGTNQKKEPTGFIRLVKDLGLEEVAVRLAIRSLIQANLVAVNTFMRSSVGKIATFAYNVYVTKRTIDVTEAEVEHSKEKIALLDKSIADFEAKTKTTWTPKILKVIDFFMPEELMAAVSKNYIFPNPPCMIAISPKCDGDLTGFLASGTSISYKFYPKEIKDAHVKILSNNYSLQTAMKLSTGKYSFENIDVEKTKAEIQKLEHIRDNLEKNLLKNKINLAQKEKIYNQLAEDQNFFPPSILAAVKDTNTKSKGTLKSPANSEIKSLKDEQASPTIEPNREVATVATDSLPATDSQNSVVEKEVIYDDFGNSNIYKKESDLFQIISNRYFQIFNR